MTNRFKGLDLINRVLEELWTEVHDIVQQAVIKTILKKKKWKKANWLSKEALQIAEKRREVKGKGEKERYTQLNAEFRRIARRDKKAFLSDQCKEIEENNRMGKSRDILKKIRDTTGIFHAKMGSIKDTNGMDLPEAEDIKRCQEYTESESESEVAQSCPTLPTRLLRPWNFPGKNTRVGCHFLLQGNLPDPGIEPVSPASRVDSLPLSHQGSP